MKNIMIEGYIYATYGDYLKQFNFNFIDTFGNGVNNSLVNAGFIPLAPYTIEIEIPASVDLHKGHLVGLQKQRKLILAQNQGKLNEIDAQIQKFMAIESK